MTFHANLDKDALRDAILRHLQTSIGKEVALATRYDWRMALTLALRDMVVSPWLDSFQAARAAQGKRVYYLSLEFLIGRLLGDVALNLGVEDAARGAMAMLDQDYDDVIHDEPDAALGNGGLGRLAACFMDSLSTLGIPAFGYGIRYEHGLFEQHFEDGRQIERAETWLSQRHGWEFERPELAYEIGFGGHVGEDGHWYPGETVIATAYDTPIVGWKGRWANTLRLWSAKSTVLLDLQSFNCGDLVGATVPEALARAISRVLYPDDTTDVGKELRLKQEYFFTAASLRDILRRFLSEGHAIETLADHAAIQLNDTHPAIAGPELVRLLHDEHKVPFDSAITLARNCLGYTNHTLLPEALERWDIGLFGHVLPRHLQIIQGIEADHCARSGIRIIEDHSVKMGELAFVMAHAVNGVSVLHSDLVKQTVFHDLNRDYPDRILNQTNGVTPRRWLYSCNPPLRHLISETIGAEWVDHLERLRDLEPHIEDAAFRERFAAAKRTNKVALSNWLAGQGGPLLDPSAMFDVQIKRIHEYKRQLMNILETIAHWNDLRDSPNKDWTPRVKIFGGKAAPGYAVAKEVIHLINDVARTLNEDPITRDLLQVVYPPNYNVSMAERLIPAADLSEQISTAGKEASGTGNMKFALNGAPTIGTLDGANVEIREHVGAENFFLFGLTAQEVMDRRAEPDFARNAINACPPLARVLEQIATGVFSPGDPGRYSNLVNILWNHDYFLVTCDFADYYRTQQRVNDAYADADGWTRIAALNTARTGWFSSDRTIEGYARDIWGVSSLLEPGER